MHHWASVYFYQYGSGSPALHNDSNETPTLHIGRHSFILSPIVNLHENYIEIFIFHHVHHSEINETSDQPNSLKDEAQKNNGSEK